MSEWVQEGGFWFATGQTQQEWLHGSCIDPACEYAEELFVDGERLVQVLRIEELEPGHRFFSYDQDRINIGDNPAGRLVETSVTNRAFVGPAINVVIRNLVVEKYANQAQHGAIDSRRYSNDGFTTGANWVVENNEVCWNHGAGIRVNSGGFVQANYIHHNGQLGVAAGGNAVTIVGSDIAYNHFAGFNYDWEAGGSKFAFTTNLFVTENSVHHNDGAGLWTDINNLNTTYRRNRVEYNGCIGIWHEISYAATIEDNLIVGNGFGHSTWGLGAGIVVAASSDVDIIGNTLIDNADGIVGIQQNRGEGASDPYVVENMFVDNNCVRQAGDSIGVLQDISSNKPFCCRDNSFVANPYEFLNPNNVRFMKWNNTSFTLNDWKTHHASDGVPGKCNRSPPIPFPSSNEANTTIAPAQR